MLDDLAPQPVLQSFLNSFCDGTHRERVGALGMLMLLEPTREALDRYAEDLVRQARAARHSWEEIGRALGVPKQTAHRRYAHIERPSP